MNELTIIQQGGGAYIDSREVAEYIGKRHDNLLRDIAGYLKIMKNSNVLNFEGVSFFKESTYLDGKGETRPCYLLSKMGCEMVANKLTGEKGVLFTAAYVTKFNAMEIAERERQMAAQGRPRLAEFNSAVRNVLTGMSRAETEPKKVMSFLRGVYNPLGIEVLTDGGGHKYCTASEIALAHSIFSITGRPHAHAVSAIIAKLDLPLENHVAVLHYGLAGVSVRYDYTIVFAVAEWIKTHGNPTTIPHNGIDYHVYYNRQLSLLEYLNGDYDDDNLSYTAKELDEMCWKYDDCDECPGKQICITEKL